MPEGDKTLSALFKKVDKNDELVDSINQRTFSVKKDTEKSDSSKTPFQHTPLKKLEEFEQQKN